MQRYGTIFSYEQELESETECLVFPEHNATSSPNILIEIPHLMSDDEHT